jgi:hypothetical protein
MWQYCFCVTASQVGVHHTLYPWYIVEQMRCFTSIPRKQSVRDRFSVQFILNGIYTGNLENNL